MNYRVLYILVCFIFILSTLYAQDNGWNNIEEFENSLTALPEENTLSNSEILLSLKYGFLLPFSSTYYYPVFASSEIKDGFDFSDIINKIYIEKIIEDSFFLEVDYDSDRGEFLFGEEGNTYSVLYRGPYYDFLKEFSLGNKYQSISGSYFTSFDEGSSDSFSFRVLGNDEHLTLEGLFRYDTSSARKKVFYGTKQKIESIYLDIDYVKGRYFFLPDINIDHNSIALYRTKNENYETDTIINVGENDEFCLLEKDVDYTYLSGNIYNTIYLVKKLENNRDEELIVYYKDSAGNEVGDPGLGLNAIINPVSGDRSDFNKDNEYSDYFCSDSNGKTYLYLKKHKYNSYWELKNRYILEDIPEGSIPEEIKISIVNNRTGEINTHSEYIKIINGYELDDMQYTIFFNSYDSEGRFYPRPFPGVNPYPDINPFSEDNPVYNWSIYPGESASVNRIEISYTIDSDEYFLDFDIIDGSISVKIDGEKTTSSVYSMDYDSGIITFYQNSIPPSSRVEVLYKVKDLERLEDKVNAAVALGYYDDWYKIRNITSLKLPFSDIPTPQLGEEQPLILQNDTELSVLLHDPIYNPELKFEGNAEIAFSLSKPNLRNRALITDMEDRGIYSISLSANKWMIATASQIQPVGTGSFNLTERGSLYFQNYYKDDIITGTSLKELSWDNSDNESFTYSEKAGPYNTADYTDGGDDKSLVVDYLFESGQTDPFVSIVISQPEINLNGYDHFHILVKGDSIQGGNVQVFAEILKNYNEDLEENGKIDGEADPEQAGFILNPGDGEATIIGTDRYGKADGKISSEDINKNDILDDDNEEGIILQSDIDTAYIIEFGLGQNDWKLCTVDLSDLITMDDNDDNNDLGENVLSDFAEVEALRITICASDPVIQDVSGKILINGIWFSDSGFVKNITEEDNTSKNLFIQEVSEYENVTFKNNKFSEKYPDIHTELHGSKDYQEDTDYIEKTLVCKVKSTLDVNNSATFSHLFVEPVNFTHYNYLNFYIFIKSGQIIPADSDLIFIIKSPFQADLKLELPAESFIFGWNEVKVSITSPVSATINGEEISDTPQQDTNKLFREVSEIEIGFQTGDTALVDDFEFWLDEIHLSESLFSFDKAAHISGTLSYTDTLFYLFNFPVISDIELSAGFTFNEGQFIDDFDRWDYLVSGDLGFNLFKYFPFKVEYNLGEGGIKESESDLTKSVYLHNLGFETELAILPVLSHSYHWNKISEEDDWESKESLVFMETYKPFDWIFQDYYFGRNITFFSEVNDKTIFNEVHKANIKAIWDKRNNVSIFLNRNDEVKGDFIISDFVFPSYGKMIETLLTPINEVLINSIPEFHQDKATLSLLIPRQKYIGGTVNLDTTFYEYNFTEESSRDVSLSQSLRMNMTYSPDGAGKLLFTPGLARYFTWNLNKTEASLNEWDILGRTQLPLFMPPFYYILIPEDVAKNNQYGAVDNFKELEEIQSSRCTLQNQLSLDFKSITFPWYIPDVFSLKGDIITTRNDNNYIQAITYGIKTGKTFKFTKVSSHESRWLYTLIGYSFKRNFTDDVYMENTHQVSFDWQLNLSDRLSQININHSLSYKKVTEIDTLIDLDILSSLFIVLFKWPMYVERKSVFNNINKHKLKLDNKETLKCETRYTFFDEENKTSNTFLLPFLLSFEHITSFQSNDNLFFDIIYKMLGGLEEYIFDIDEESNMAPYMGFEIGINLRYTF